MPSVYALIVTRNRVNSLQRCVQALRSQTYLLSRIIVVDNDSSDGTRGWLDLQNDLIVIKQSNLGGAGGFYSGITRAIKENADWVWCMDDDGFPDKNALENLKPNNNLTPFWRNSVVLRENSTNELAFKLPIDGINYSSLNELKNLNKTINYSNPFNGTLIHKNLISKIGYPIPQLFIKGDETEYQDRAIKNGFEIETFLDSIFFHPKAREISFTETNHERLWVYFFLIKNYSIIGEKDGSFKYVKKTVWENIKVYFKESFESMYYKKITFHGFLTRLYILAFTFFVVFFNLPLILISNRKVIYLKNS